MREQLEKFDWHVYKINSHDFEKIVKLLSGFEKDRRFKINLQRLFTRLVHPFRASDIMDDVAPYEIGEVFTLHQFGLIRLLGLFETWLEHHILPPKNIAFPKSRNPNYTGLRERKDALKRSGYSLICEAELKSWAELRNAVTHSPPSQTSFIEIRLSDLEELKVLLLDVTDDLWKQKEARDGILRIHGEFGLAPPSADQISDGELE